MSKQNISSNLFKTKCYFKRFLKKEFLSSQLERLFIIFLNMTTQKLLVIILSKRIMGLKFWMENILQNDNTLKKNHGTIFISQILLKTVLSVLQISGLEENDTICLSQRTSSKIFKILKNIKLFTQNHICQETMDKFNLR